jgi:hypothetical protein
MTSVKILGTSGDVTMCEACGKQDLKKTVAIDIDGEVHYYGCDCASRVIGWSAADIAKAQAKSDKEAVQRKRDADRRLRTRYEAHPAYIKASELTAQGRAQYRWLKDFPADLNDSIRQLCAQAWQETNGGINA